MIIIIKKKGIDIGLISNLFLIRKRQKNPVMIKMSRWHGQ